MAVVVVVVVTLLSQPRPSQARAGRRRSRGLLPAAQPSGSGRADTQSGVTTLRNYGESTHVTARMRGR